MTAFTGEQGCPCTDVSTILSSLTERSCTTTDGQSGVLISPRSGSCVPLSYGSDTCLQHDLLHDPTCNMAQANGADIPAYCIPSFCYVDMESCILNSEERVFRSDYFGEVDVFYSYTTCNSTYNFAESALLGGTPIKAVIPSSSSGVLVYKPFGGGMDVYYNNSIPFEGVYIDYINNLLNISDGDIQQVQYTSRSMVSSTLHPTSSYTAAVQDVQDGLADVAIGPFWITAQRLRMTPFTVPMIYDKTVLVVPKPKDNNTIRQQTSKVLEPFTPGLWGLVVLIIIFTAFLSVWFSDKPRGKATRRNSFEFKRTQRRLSVEAQKYVRKRRNVYARKILDAFLENGMFFFSAGVEQNEGASLPHKLLLFGFSFFILISVSAYVANLAAFLTRAGSETVGSMEEVVERGLKLCAHPALTDELKNKWPEAVFVFSTTQENGFLGMFDDYDAGKCDVMAVGREDTTMNLELMNKFCERGLLFTDALIMENPMAFPIKPELAAGFSYWMYQGEMYDDISVENSKVKFKPNADCNAELSEQDEENSDYTQISPLNMSFPIMFWGIFSVIAIILQIIHLCKTKRGKDSVMLGNTSKFSLFAKSVRSFGSTKDIYREKDDDDETIVPSGPATKSQYDMETNLPQNTQNNIEPMPFLHESDVSEKDGIDEFDEYGLTCRSPNSRVGIMASGANTQIRNISVRFASEHDVKNSDSDIDLDGHSKMVQELREIKCDIERLVNKEAFSEFLKCIQEIKNHED